ncbi:MAG TPA: SprT-like domain-containing protein [Thermoanaerobaculia bacterium]|nr:SprT-like domain-containing protein [Thermoanaerobaculia bacterium]
MQLSFPMAEPDAEVRLQHLYDRLSERFHFGSARVRVSPRKLTGGEIVYGKPHRITISGHMSAAAQEETLRHEAAHAWAHSIEGARAAHGPLFRSLARQLGARGGPAPETEALRRFRDARARVLYRCAGCRRLFRRFRPFRGVRECLACLRAGRPARLSRVRPVPEG